jgi:splicing factor 3A subunit 1
MVATATEPETALALPTDVKHDDNDEDVVQGRTTGLIIPPPVIKSVLEKTAEWVAKKGNVFLEQIRIKRGDNPQFAFVFPSSPYHTYFLHRTDELALEIHNKQNGIAPPPSAAPAAASATTQPSPAPADGRTTSEAKPAATNATPAAHTTPSVAAPSTDGGVSSSVSRAPVVSALAEALKVKNEKPPQSYKFSMPRNPVDVSSKSAELMRLTAQFTAIKGKSFLTQLARREMGNPDFYFLNALSPHFVQVFSPLLAAYKTILNGEQKAANKAKMEKLMQDHSVLLNQAVHRVTWTRAKEEEKRAKERAEREDKQAFLEIDWQDFVVVETITFEDPTAEAPTPAPDQTPAAAPVSGSTTDATGVPETQATAAGEQAGAAGVVAGTTVVQGDDSDDGMDMDDSDMDDDDDGEEVVIRTDHVPRVVEESQAPGGDLVTLHGRQVPVDQANEQLRIELIDPKWKQQQKVFQERQKTTPFEAERDIAKNIERLAAKRPDVFSNRSDNANGSGSGAPTVSASGEGWAQNQHTAAAEAEKRAAELDRQQVRQMVSRAKAANEPSTPDMPPPSTTPTPTQSKKRPAAALASTPAPPAPVRTPAAIPAPPRALQPQAPSMPSMPAGPPPPMPPMPSAPMPQAPPMPMGAPPPDAVVAPPPGVGVVGVAPTAIPPPPSASVALAAPDAKRAKIDAGGDVAAGLRIIVGVPQDTDNNNNEWKLNGQAVQLIVPEMTLTIRELKELLVQEIGPVPLSRFQLKAPSGFLKDKKSLADHKLTSGVVLEMKMKTRGR